MRGSVDQPVLVLLRGQGGEPGELGADAPHRRIVSKVSILRQPPDGPAVATGRCPRRPSPGSPANASDGSGGQSPVQITPTSASWINQIERWFAELTRKQLQRGVHASVKDLEADIITFIERHNENPKPFKWTKSADEILASVKRFCHRVDQNLCPEL